MRMPLMQITAVQRSTGGHILYAVDVEGQLWSRQSDSTGTLDIAGWKKESLPNVQE